MYKQHSHEWATRIPRNHRLNADYETIGSKYKHVEIWRAHHGFAADPAIYIIHHKDGNKRNNEVCADESGRCLVLNCGNLALMTRADHIREHKPGKMSGKKGFVDTRPRRRRQ